MTTENQIKPRFEFRAFGHHLEELINKMNQLSKVERIRDIYEVYLMSAGNIKNNVKIRNKMLDIKVLLSEKKSLELWEPYLVGEFPMKASIIRSEVFPAFGVESPPFERDVYTLVQFLDELISPDPDIIAVYTQKKRYAYTINNCICEVAEVIINGALIKTIAVESEDLKDILDTKTLIGFNEQEENVNYPLAIKRVIGLFPRPMDHLHLTKN
ncbi:MAG: hypothetical protein HN921_00320 [Bacteroidetes bacterium]|nr:hypothetical protein [Bacteroidota bacterium]